MAAPSWCAKLKNIWVEEKRRWQAAAKGRFMSGYLNEFIKLIFDRLIFAHSHELIERISY